MHDARVPHYDLALIYRYHFVGWRFQPHPYNDASRRNTCTQFCEWQILFYINFIECAHAISDQLYARVMCVRCVTANVIDDSVAVRSFDTRTSHTHTHGISNSIYTSTQSNVCADNFGCRAQISLSYPHGPNDATYATTAYGAANNLFRLWLLACDTFAASAEACIFCALFDELFWCCLARSSHCVFPSMCYARTH